MELGTSCSCCFVLGWLHCVRPPFYEEHARCGTKSSIFPWWADKLHEERFCHPFKLTWSKNASDSSRREWTFELFILYVLFLRKKKLFHHPDPNCKTSSGNSDICAFCWLIQAKDINNLDKKLLDGRYFTKHFHEFWVTKGQLLRSFTWMKIKKTLFSEWQS